MNKSELLADLNQFSGTMEYHRHSPRLLLTDGTLFLAENAGAFWLFDIVASILPMIETKHRNEYFLSVKLAVNPDRTAVFTVDNGNGRVYYRQEIPFTDFPLDKMNIFVEDNGSEWVALLPSEH